MRRPALRRLRAALLAPVLLTLFAAAPAGAVVRQDSGLWAGAVVRSPSWKGFRGAFLLQTRTRADWSTLERVLLRPWIAYTVNDAISLAVGYDAHFVESPLNFTEQRAWQEIALALPFRGFDFSQRFRLEERFFEGQSFTAVRLRYLAGVRSPELCWKVRAAFRNEFFFNLNSPNTLLAAGFAENRLFLGGQRPIGSWMSAELGYQAQWLRLTPNSLVNHTVVLGLAFDL